MKSEPMPRFTLDRYTEEPPVSPEEEARGALEELHAMAWKAAERIEEILRDSAVPDSRKIALAQLVLDRVYGKPEEMLKIRYGERAAEESRARIRGLVKDLDASSCDRR